MYSKASLLILFVVFVAISKGAWDIHQKAMVAITERDISARSLYDLQSRTVELSASLDRLNSNIGIEAEVRQKYTVARQGEEVVVVVDDIIKKGENSDAADKKSIFGIVASFFGF